MSFMHHFVVSAIVRFGRSTVGNGLGSFFFFFSFVAAMPLQCSSNECSSWFGCSIRFFPIRNWATRTMLPMSGWLSVLIFQCPRFISSPLIITMSITTSVTNYYCYVDFEWFFFVFQVGFSLRATRCSCFHLLHKAYLHRLIFLHRFFIVSRSLSWGAGSGKFTSSPTIKLFGFRIR